MAIDRSWLQKLSRSNSTWAILIGFILVIIICLIALIERAWRALLINFLFFTPLALGMLAWSAILSVTKATWAGASRRLLEQGFSFAAFSVLVLLILWWRGYQCAPWIHFDDKRGVWLENGFIFGRNLIALLAVWIVAGVFLVRRNIGQGIVTGGFLILVYSIAFSLMGFDLVMSLGPKWHSTLIGAYFFVSGLYAAVTAWALVYSLQPAPNADSLQDMGKLITTFCLLTAYMMYSQLLPIWYENLPDETLFVAPRLKFLPWSQVSVVLLVVVYLGPLLLFLTQRAKRNRVYVASACTLILMGLWTERWWLVSPEFNSKHLDFGFWEIAFILIFAGVFISCLRKTDGFIVFSERKSAS